MENVEIKEKKALNCGKVIKILAILALVCGFFGCLLGFFYYDYNKVNGEWVYELTFQFDFLSFFIDLSPAILFIVYLYKFYDELKATDLIPIILGVTMLSIAFNTSSGGVIALLLCVTTCVLAIISSLKGFENKTFVIIFMSCALLCNVLTLISIFSMIDYYIEEEQYLYIVTSLLRIIGSILFYIAFCVFALKNKIPSIIKLSRTKEKGEKVDSEQELKLLRNKLELGMITEEEYQAQRAEIIKNL